MNFAFTMKGAFFLFFLIACRETVKKSEPLKEVNESRVSKYFNSNHWTYPVDIDFDSSKGFEIMNIDSNVLRHALIEWCYRDSLIRGLHEGILMSTFRFDSTRSTSTKYSFDCIVESFEEAEIRDGAAMPIEGHGIVNNELLVQREREHTFHVRIIRSSF